MFIVQNELRPAEIQNALFDLMRNGIDSVRVCSAYISMAGSEILFDGICRSAPEGNHERVTKTIVTSLDFGLTEPAALEFWRDTGSCQVLVAGASLLEEGSIIPSAAFHPKLYLFGRANGSIGGLVGSANLTNRGLTINSEVAWLEMEYEQIALVNQAWDAAVQPAVPLTREILETYRAIRIRFLPERPIQELEPVPEPDIGPLGQFAAFGDADIDPAAYGQMWVQSHGLQGGARTQLELPRGSHRFFGANFRDYDFDRVDHIAEPILVSGRSVWNDRPLTWHGDNAMERINLPSIAMGGFPYENSLILFRRIAPNTFELRVHRWDSDAARAYLETSWRAGLVFRVGRNSNRLAGFMA
jgi:HKD family nuclease